MNRLLRHAGLACLVALAAGLHGRSAKADDPKEAPSAARLAEAKELFRRGVALFGAGDVERALDFFLRSRDAFPSSQNLINAALCLDKLGRFDEATELYEDVLVRFAAELDEADRRGIERSLAALRPKVGALEVSSNVDGTVLVDGRARAKLPIRVSLRVLPGKHLVRVVKDGWVTSEGVVVVAAGARAVIDLKLAPLAAAGALRVEDATNPGARVFVDRVDVGAVPWEGTLGPGPHVVWVGRGDLGSGPERANVIQGQTVLLRVRSQPLGAPVRMTPTPRTAALTIDGVAVGNGMFETRLGVGRHRVVASEEGYLDAEREVVVGPVGSPPVSLSLELAIDPRHPRWPRAGRFSIAAWGGYGWGTSPGGSAESGCPNACNGSPTLSGGGGGVRFGYRFPFGLGLELGAGYLAFATAFQRTVTDDVGQTHEHHITYALRDAVRIMGPFAGAGVTQRLVFQQRFAFTVGASVDAMVVSARDVVTGTLTEGKSTVKAAPDADGTPAQAAALFFAPEARFDVTFDKLTLGVGMFVPIFPIAGPVLENGTLRPTDRCTKVNPVTCTQGSAAITGERAFAQFAFFVPNVYFAYAF